MGFSRGKAASADYFHDADRSGSTWNGQLHQNGAIVGRPTFAQVPNRLGPFQEPPGIGTGRSNVSGITSTR
jgi:hypothetical protein